MTGLGITAVASRVWRTFAADLSAVTGFTTGTDVGRGRRRLPGPDRGTGSRHRFRKPHPRNQAWFFIGNVAGRTSLALFVLAALRVLRLRLALAGALVIAATSVVQFVWFTTRGDLGFEAWGFLAFTTAALATASLIVMFTVVSRHEGASEDPQSWNEVPVSASP